MFKKFFEKLRLIYKDPSLSKKILFILGALIVFRFLANIPVPGVDLERLNQFFNNTSLDFLGLVNLMSGGGLTSLSIMMLGVGPYITASIIMQVMTMIWPKLKQMNQEEGEVGRKKFMQYSRYLTVPIAIVQGFGFLIFLQQQGAIGTLTMHELVTNVIIITAGSMLLMWIGELISEFGIGNGVSIIIFGGIVAGLPTAISQQILSFDVSQIPTYLAFIAVGLLIIVGVVYVTEAERPVPVTYAKQLKGSGAAAVGGASTYLPLRLNQAGVIPIIFALSILMLPQLVVNLLSVVQNSIAQGITNFIQTFLANQLYYGITYFMLVFLFTYFYTAITFDPDGISKNLQKSGAFIPGVRPGESTAKHLGNILSRLTLVGATFLGFIAVVPFIVQGFTGITALSIGGTSLLIVISVLIDLLKKTDAQIAMREY
jgi:preprotein translocase subunit SecY